MIFYLTIKTDTPLSHVPFIESIDITLNGEEKQCSWDETDAALDGCYVDYRFKGVAYVTDDDEIYANNTVKSDSIVTISKDFWWMEDDEGEEFDFKIVGFHIMDYDEEKDEEVLLSVIDNR